MSKLNKKIEGKDCEIEKCKEKIKHLQDDALLNESLIETRITELKEKKEVDTGELFCYESYKNKAFITIETLPNNLSAFSTTLAMSTVA